ncbi:MAG: hypothetical protein ACKV2Q_31310 [Planctomycetaceae bacterium]
MSRKLQRERFEWANACTFLIDSGIAATVGDQPTAIRCLQSAFERFTACEMQLHLNMAKLRLGQLTDKQTGESLEAEALNWLVSQGVREPYRLAEVYAPGFRRLVSNCASACSTHPCRSSARPWR